MDEQEKCQSSKVNVNLQTWDQLQSVRMNENSCSRVVLELYYYCRIKTLS